MLHNLDFKCGSLLNDELPSFGAMWTGLLVYTAHNPEEHHHHSHRRENLRSHMVVYLLVSRRPEDVQ
jgi:hypothetical protein